MTSTGEARHATSSQISMEFCCPTGHPFAVFGVRKIVDALVGEKWRLLLTFFYFVHILSRKICEPLSCLCSLSNSIVWGK